MASNVSIAKVKKGDTVILCAFTGMKIGVKEVTAVDKNTVTISTDKGEIVFDRKTAKQVDPQPKAARFANFIIEDDGSYKAPVRKKKEEKPAKKNTKKAKPEPESEEDEDEAEETPAPKKTKKATTKKAPVKKQPEPDPEEEDDEDEDFDDDDFEEVE